MTNDFTFVAYYRVSTERQGQSGLGLDAQRAAVAAFMKGKGELEGEFVEVESGRKNERPQLVSALALCRRKPGRVLLIAKGPSGNTRIGWRVILPSADSRCLKGLLCRLDD